MPKTAAPSPVPAAAAAVAAVPAEAAGVLSGQVVNAETGQPLRYASVRLRGPGLPEKGISVTTDETGHYLARVPPGRYDVTFTYMLFPPQTVKGIEISADRPRDLGASLTRDSMVEVKGQVLGSEDNLPLAGASVSMSRLGAAGRPHGAITDNEGRFSVQVPVGTYDVSALLFSYKKKTLPLLDVTVLGAPPLRILMDPEVVKVKEIVVTGDKIKNTKVSELQTRRKSATVNDGINREAISKSTDSDAGQVLGRVTGISVRDGKYLVVRGLSERYASTQLNGVRIGSPEPNRKIVPLDIFPAGLLDNINIQKAYSPDQPGEFGGGSVQIVTREIPETPIFQQTIGTGVNVADTSAPPLGYRGGGLDFLGIDDGTRELPDLIRKMAGNQIIVARSPLNPTGPGFSNDEIAAFAKSFEDQWQPRQANTPLKSDMSLTAGRRMQLAGRPLGIIASGSYSRSANTSEGERNFYQSLDLQPKALYKEVASNRSVLWGGTGTLTWRLSANSSIKGTLFHSHSSDDDTRRYEGQNFDFDQPYRSERLMFVQRSLTAQTVGSEHQLPWFKSRFEWKYNRSTAHREEPDRRENGYELLTIETDDGDTTVWRFSRTGASRLFSDVDDTDHGLEGHLTIPFHSWAEGEARVKVGGLNQTKDRASWTRRFTYSAGRASGSDLTLPVDTLLSDPNYGRLVNFKETTRGSDFYWADQSLHGWYAMVDLPVAKRLRVLTGARVEDSRQNIITYSDAVFTSAKKSYGNHNSDIMPALNLTYAASAKTNLRLAASQTVSRPDLRELTNFDLTDYQSGSPKTGNPKLKRARIQAYDLRWETFPTLGELFAASLFYKKLIDPIENTIQGGEAPREFPNNGGKGRNLGMEFELRFGLGRLAHRFERFSTTANLTLVNSRVTLPASGVQSSATRPLEGQSPYVANFGLYYTSPAGRTELSFYYNSFGRRLTGVGIYGQPDIYERARTTLDLVATHKLTPGLRLKLAGKNLSNAKRIIDQGGLIRESAQSGSTFSISLTSGS